MGALGSRYSEYEQAFAAALQGRPDRHIIGARVDVPGHSIYSVIAVKPAQGSRGLMVSADAAAAVGDNRVKINPHFIYFTDNLGIYLEAIESTQPTAVTVNNDSNKAQVIYPATASVARTESSSHPMYMPRRDNVAMPTADDLRSELSVD
jgi:hypothetical protein